jgi:Mn-dependent DtxR family transcriptional regulator
MSDIKGNILELLQGGGTLFTAEIAKTLKISSATASKYLGILEAEGKVKKERRTPYIYWKKA